LKKYINTFFLVSFVVLLFTSCDNSNNDLVSKISFSEKLPSEVNLEKLPSINFKNIKENRLDLNQKTYWFKIDLKSTSVEKIIGLRIDEAYVKNLAIYNSELKNEVTLKNPKKARFYIDLKYPTKTIYAKIEFKRNPFLIIEAYAQKEIASIKNSDLYKNAAYYIVVFVFFITILSLAYFFKKTVFVWHALFQFSVNLCIALFDGTLTGFITSEKLMIHIIGFTFLAIPFFTTLYFIKALRVKKHYPKTTKVLTYLFIPITVLNIVFHLTENYTIIAIQDLLNSIFYIVIFILSIMLFNKVRFAKYFLLAYTILFSIGILYSINISFGYRFLPFDINTLKLAVIIEIIVLTYASILKSKKMYVENTLIKQQLEEQKFNIENIQNEKQAILNESLSSIYSKNNFTKREKEVFELIIKGLNNQQIADKLFISINTVKYHSRNIYEKLNISKRSELFDKYLNT